ncbi:MAG: hypothetical protein H3C58_00925 [Fimbriimonadaceae bacterium]|nr:hypothetical protein [Fimbriimonadaceae bacterium]
MTGLAVLVGWMGVFAPLPGWKVVAAGPPVSYFNTVIWADNGSFVGQGPGASGVAVFRFDAEEGSLAIWPKGHLDHRQRDCGAMLASFVAGERYDTYDIASGRLLMSVPMPAFRVGSTVVSGNRAWDLQTGQEVVPIPGLLYDSPKRRLAVTRREGARGSTILLTEFEPGTDRALKSHPLRYEPADTAVFGSPDGGPFAVRQGIRGWVDQVFNSKFEPVLTDYWRINAWTPFGVLQHPQPRELGDRPKKLRLANPETGEVLWQIELDCADLAQWDGSYIRLYSPERATYDRFGNRIIPEPPVAQRPRRAYTVYRQEWAISFRGPRTVVWRRQEGEQ